MLHHIGRTAIVAAILALAAPAMAQTAAAPSQQSPDQWRASKLVGVSIYGPDNKTVGKVSDLLMSKDGKIQLIVIGIGGLLGIGEKDVAVPYDQVKFTDEPITPPAAAAGATAPNNNMAAGSTAGNTMAGGNMAGASPGGGMAPAGTNAGAGAGGAVGAAANDPANRSTSYPDHGTVGMTADQLKNAPTFQYAK